MSYIVTKYALTKGLFEAPADAEIVSGKYLRFRAGPHHYEFLSPGQYATGVLEAEAQAMDMRDRKIASLKKQLARHVSRKTFPVKPAQAVTP